ncbi:GNAT family N-acetyltransferase [Kitasatospora sp. NPDC089913]|uniref:GNAT family N-acetyltransferase n=1 Tax=Kitasatospora sp. NPDC089913 TaxID=3364080 RepID=UPI00382C0751
MNDTMVLPVDADPSAPALLLRPWRNEDAPALVEVYRDPVLRRWTTSVVDDEADALRWVGTQQEAWAAGHRFAFAVLEALPGAEPGPPLGNLVLKRVSPGGHTAEVGYWTSAPARGRGIAPRALEALTGWAFDTLGPTGLQRLELLHQVDNTASCRVAEKSRYAFDRVLTAAPPAYPLQGHLHVRLRSTPEQLR